MSNMFVPQNNLTMYSAILEIEGDCIENYYAGVSYEPLLFRFHISLDCNPCVVVVR